MDVRIRRADRPDLPFLERMLFEAVFWRPGTERPALRVALGRPELAKLLRGFPERPGDLGLVAEADGGAPLGAAWYRLWPADDHFYGYVDPETPELGVAVEARARGDGVGGQLLEALSREASRAGHPRLSLSVEDGNPARRLYERQGYRLVGRQGTADTLLLDLRDPELWRARPREHPKAPEVPGPGQESVWDYPRPPRLEPAARTVRVELAGEVIAESRRALRVCETASPPCYYVPPGDVRTDLLARGELETFCEWKGRAACWHVRAGGRTAENAAWSYAEPTTDYAALRDHLAFFAGRVDACFLGGERVRAQPGGFYGGWITNDLVGPFKGEPGTEGW